MDASFSSLRHAQSALASASTPAARDAARVEVLSHAAGIVCGAPALALWREFHAARASVLAALQPAAA
jgi:hypothetical protein